MKGGEKKANCLGTQNNLMVSFLSVCPFFFFFLPPKYNLGARVAHNQKHKRVDTKFPRKPALSSQKIGKGVALGALTPSSTQSTYNERNCTSFPPHWAPQRLWRGAL